MVINDIIKTAVESIPDTLYMRATDQEANIEIDEVDLDGITVCIYNNLPSISHEVGSAIVANWPIEIKVLQLADFDDNDNDGDLIRDVCLEIAYTLQALTVNDIRISQSADIDNFVIDMLDSVKLYDKTLTGVELRFELPLIHAKCL